MVSGRPMCCIVKLRMSTCPKYKACIDVCLSTACVFVERETRADCRDGGGVALYGHPVPHMHACSLSTHCALWEMTQLNLDVPCWLTISVTLKPTFGAVPL